MDNNPLIFLKPNIQQEFLKDLIWSLDCKLMFTPLEIGFKLNNNMNPIDSKDIEPMQKMFYSMTMDA